MSERNERLIEELKQENTNAPGENGGDATAVPKEKLSGRYATSGLAALVLLLLAFFLGMRFIESRSERLALQTTEAAEQTASDERAMPEDGRIDINTAGLDELMTLEGIGEKKAQAIIDYRSEYGPFTDIAEITAVEGIGSGIFEKIKDDIRVS